MWRSTPLWTALAAALALAALAACGGGDPPPPSPTTTVTPTAVATPTVAATATPSPTATPAATPTPSSGAEPCDLIVVGNRYGCRGAVRSSPVPEPCEGVECVEPAPGAFEHMVWEPGEQVDWTDGAFVLETPTGRIHGYRVKTRGVARPALSHGWIQGYVSYGGSDDALLLHRETLQAFRWPSDAVELVALSSDHMLFRDRGGYRYTLMTRDGAVRTQFPVQFSAPAYYPIAFFSPDGQVLVIQEADAVYRMSVADSRPAVLYEPELRDGWSGPRLRAGYSGPLPAVGQSGRWSAWYRLSNRVPLPRLILVEVEYSRPASPDTSASDEQLEYDRELLLFNWEGVPLSAAAEPVCKGTLSPDGRYVAWEQGGKSSGGKGYVIGILPSVVIADAGTCDPLLRVRSAYLFTGDWSGQWLSNSEGFVVGVADGHAVVRLHPAPRIVPLPSLPPDFYWRPGPVPAPSGDGRYFAYDFTAVYDARDERWIRPDFGASQGPSLWFSYGTPAFAWGESHEELYYTTEFHDGAAFLWLLLQPRIEFPPFDDTFNFRVTRTGSCLALRQSYGDESAVLGCLPDGTLLSLGQPQELSREGEPYPNAFPPQPGAEAGVATTGWVYVRTADGLEGWVAHEYLDHD